MRQSAGEEKILVFGDTGDEALEYILRGNRFGFLRVERKEEIQRHFREEDVSFLLLQANGDSKSANELLSLIRGMRTVKSKPILVRLNGADERLRIMALKAGADDVVGSECSVLELLARIQALLRCYRRLITAEKPKTTMKMNGLEVDDAAKLVCVEGNRVKLTPTEYKILYLLMEKPGRVLSNRQIYESIWKMAPIGADNTVAVHIRHIREKIEKNPQNPRYLRVVWGQGYKVG